VPVHVQIEQITGTSLPPPQYMDNEPFPGLESAKSGENIVRTVYDVAVALWRRHDLNLDFMLDADEFSAGCRVTGALACVAVAGCYEYVALPDPASRHWCFGGPHPPATWAQCARDICRPHNNGVNGGGGGGGRGGGDDGGGDTGSKGNGGGKDGKRGGAGAEGKGAFGDNPRVRPEASLLSDYTCVWPPTTNE
jgi:hypothetical protein